MDVALAPLRQRRFDGGGPTLGQTGEAALLRRLVAAAPAPGMVVGSGDDAAVWRPPVGRDVVITQDALVEGVDFHRDWITPFQLGARLLTVSLSDLAAMGAEPAACLATVCAPPATARDDVLAIQAGLAEAAARHACPLVGGDVSRIDGPLVFDLAALGTVEQDRALRRDAGRVGELLVVTGQLGEAAAGLQLLLNGRVAQTRQQQSWIEVQLQARARLAEGRALVEAGVHCAGDLSDGMLVDAARTAAASGCAAELWLDAMPIAPGIEATGDRLELALGGGEDFELLFSVAEPRWRELLEAWPPSLAPLRAVGQLVAGSGLQLLDTRGGEPVEAPRVLSEHFG